MTFAYPYLLAAPVVMLVLALFERSQRLAVPCADGDLLKAVAPSLKLRFRRPILLSLLSLFLILLSIAAARPQKITVVQDEFEGRDLMLVLDVSGSMKERDFEHSGSYMNRLQAVKLVVSEFIQNRVGDRIGVVAFGTSAFLQSPLTTDHALLVELVNLLQVGVVGEGTAIGDGLGVALKRLRELPGNTKAIILLTDGANNSGTVLPLQAAKVASDLGIKIHSIGIGSDQATAPSFGSIFMGRPPEYDEETLKEISKLSSGVYFHATSFEGLRAVYDEIDKLEQREDVSPSKQIVEEQFYPFAAGALLCFIAYWTLVSSFFMKVP